MNYPNAHKGISRILTAQWIQLVSLALILIGGIISAVFAVSAQLLSEVPSDISELAVNASLMRAGIGGILLMVGAVIAVVGIIMNLIGLNTARKDEDQFTTAFWLCIGSLVAAVLVAVFQARNPGVANWLNLVQKVMWLAVIEYAVNGIINLAEKLKNTAVAELGRKLRFLILVLYAIAMVLTVFTSGKLSGIITIADTVLELIVYIIYIVILVKAKKMLAAAA